MDDIPVKNLDDLSERSGEEDDLDMAALDNWQSRHLKRSFTVRSDDKTPTDLLQLSK